MEKSNDNETMAVIELRGTEFYIDPDSEKLIQVNNPGNWISLDQCVKLHECYFGLDYDTATKNIAVPENMADTACDIPLPLELLYTPKEFVANALKDKSYCKRELEKCATELYKLYDADIKNGNKSIKEMKRQPKKSRRKSHRL